MSLFHFFLIMFVCCAAAWGLCQLLSKFFSGPPGVPSFVYYLIWAVAIIIIVVTLAKALGLSDIDPQIPKLR